MSRIAQPSMFAVNRALVLQAARRTGVREDDLHGGAIMAAAVVAAAAARASSQPTLARELMHLAGDSALSVKWDAATPLPPALVHRLLVMALGANAEALPVVLGHTTGLPAASARAATDIAGDVVLWALAQSIRRDDHGLAAWFVRESEVAAQQLPAGLVRFLEGAAPWHPAPE